MGQEILRSELRRELDAGRPRCALAVGECFCQYGLQCWISLEGH
jgi:hypothetical protein